MAEKVVSFKLLGSAVITINGSPWTSHAKKGEAILFFLAVESAASRELLAELLWGSCGTAEQARRHLRDTLYLLKRRLGMELVVSKGRNSLQLNPAIRSSCDVDALLRGGELSAYQGEFLHDFGLTDAPEYEEWILQTRERLRESYLNLLNQAVQEELDSGDGVQAEAHLKDYLREDPMAEHMAVRLMRLYLEAREYHKASSIYHRLRKELSDELGIAPLKDTVALYREIMEQWNREAEESKYVDIYDFVGRSRVLSQLQRVVSHTGQARGALVCGEAGVGKTYLLSYFMDSAQVRQHLIVSSSCYQSKATIPLYPWQSIVAGLAQNIISLEIKVADETLHMLAKVFPSLSLLHPFRTPDKLQEQLPMYDALEALLNLVLAVSEHRPILLVLEDVQWIDPISVYYLEQMLRRLPRERFALLMTCRSSQNENLQQFLDTALKEQLLTYCCLEPFTREETLRFIERCGDVRLGESVLGRLYALTRGNPLRLNRALDVLREQGGERVDQLSLENEFALLTDGLSEDGLQILNMVSMFLDDAPYEVLRQMSDKTPGQLLYLCQELNRRGLIQERNDGGQLSLTLVQKQCRDFLYNKLPSLNRKLMHRAIIDILLTLPVGTVPDRDSMLEYHYSQVGDQLRAFQYRVRNISSYISNCYDVSGGGLPRLYREENYEDNSNNQLWELFERLEGELGELQRTAKDHALLDEQRITILYAKSCFGIFTGRYGKALPALQELLSLPDGNMEVKVRAHRQMANYAIQVADTDLLETHIQAGIACAKACDDKVNEPIFMRYLGLLAFLRGDYPLARNHFQTALSLVHETFKSGFFYEIQLSYGHNYMGDTYWMEGRYQEAQAQYEQALNAVKNKSFSTCKPIVCNSLGQLWLAMGDYQCAEDSFEQAYQLFLQIRSTYGLTTTESYLSLFACAEGDYKRAAELLLAAKYHADTFRNPRQQGLVYLIQAILRKYCDTNGLDNEISKLLDQPLTYYIGKSVFSSRTGVWGQKLFNSLFTLGGEDTLVGLWKFGKKKKR